MSTVVYRNQDLLDGSNSMFRVAFDVYSPRPHFIFLSKESGISDYQQLSNSGRAELSRAIQQLRQKYQLTKATFSLHRGSWGSDDAKFHAHLCVDVGKYLHIFRAGKFVLGKDSVTKQWKASQNPADYLLNVQGWPFKSYYGEDLRDIEAYRRSGKRLTRKVLPNNIGESPLTINTVLHSSLPRIGFRLTSPRAQASNVHVLNMMEKYAANLGLTRVSGDPVLGCHVCLLIGTGAVEAAFSGEEDIVGYIELAGLKFYQLCSSQGLADSWLAQYKGLGDYRPRT